MSRGCVLDNSAGCKHSFPLKFSQSSRVCVCVHRFKLMIMINSSFSQSGIVKISAVVIVEHVDFFHSVESQCYMVNF